MASHQLSNCNWNVESAQRPGSAVDTQHAMLAVLMDIRVALDQVCYQLSVLHCQSFLEMPHTLKRIARNTTKKPKTARLRRVA